MMTEETNNNPFAVGDAKTVTEPAKGLPNVDAILQIPVSVKVVLGSATISVASLAKLGRGAVIPLNKKVGDPVDVTVNGRLVARGEVVVLEDDNSRFGISLTEVVGLPDTLGGKGSDRG